MTRPAGTPTTPEVLVLEAVAVLFIAGLSLVVTAIAGLAGLWWALFAAGIMLAAVAVVLARAPRRSTSTKPAPDAQDAA